MLKRISILMLCAALCICVFTGCNTKPSTAPPAAPASDTEAVQPLAASPNPAASTTSAKKPKYVFLFIGDGMSHVQINAAQVYMGNNTPGAVDTYGLNFTGFPVAGIATTHDSTSFCPDSASTATSMSTGVKTHSGVIGMEADKTTAAKNISEILKEEGMKIGIISSVTINHATPAAFYAHTPSRNEYYDIALQMADSGFDYFAGGTIGSPTGSDGSQQSAFDVLAENGYTVVDTAEAIRGLDSSAGKVYAVAPTLQDSGAMAYTLDAAEDDITLAEFVEKGIEILDNDKGFFMMCESGKVDWACHANDALSAIIDVIGFEAAIQKAVDFAALHPDETLIVVTGDHETGGMAIGYATTGYDTAFSILAEQKMSYVEFDSLISDMKKENERLTFDDVLPVVKDSFGLVAPGDPDAATLENDAMLLSDYEFAKLKNGFEESMKSGDDRDESIESALLYGGYDPLSVSLTHIINNKAGIGWTSYAHTGTPVPVFSMGAGSELFSGSYDNTDIFNKLIEALGL